MSGARLVAMVLAFLAISSALRVGADDVPSPYCYCTDVLNIPRKSLLLAWKLRNTPELLLDNQRVCTAEELSPESARCDWEYDLIDVGVLRPEKDTVLRMVSTGRSHVTGSGSDSTLDALECRQSRLVEVFSTGGGRLQQVSSTVFVVDSLVWVNQDSTCCPSHERHTRFEWDTATHTYVSKGATYFKVDSTTRKRSQVAKPDNGER